MPATAREWKHEVRAQAVAELGRQGQTKHLATQLLEMARCFGALRVDALFRMPRPKSHWRTGRHAGRLKASALDFHISKPDVDNLYKAVLDALGEHDDCPSLVWADDAQVAQGRISKRYVRVGEEPGATVAIWELT